MFVSVICDTEFSFCDSASILLLIFNTLLMFYFNDLILSFIYLYKYLLIFQAITLLDKLYTFFTASRKAHITHFTKHFIKIEFLDKYDTFMEMCSPNIHSAYGEVQILFIVFRLCRPIYKEFDEWPEISLEPDPPKEKKKESPEINTNQTTKDFIQK